MTTLSPFDIAADTDDECFTRSRIGLMQRQRVWELLTPLLQFYPRPLNILEINCGTGEDALQLARLGHRVVATDASEKMIQLAKQKADKISSTKSSPHFLTYSFDQLVGLDVKKPFDLVISNFGGLNCIDEKEIIQLRNVLSGMVTDRGQLLLVVMSKFCAWEVLYYSMKGKFNSAFRRSKGFVPFYVNQHAMNIYYYSPSRILTLFKPAFNLSRSKPVGLFIPPSYLEPVFSKRPGLLESLNRWERKWGLPGLSFLADHYCVILNKNKS